MAAALSSLRIRGFPQLAASYFVNELGDWLATVALAVLVFDHTGSALATAGFFLAQQFLPALLIPAVVARLEVFRTRRVLPILYLSEAVAFLALAALADAFLFAAIIAIAALDGAIAGSARALTRGVSGAMLSEHGRLREGNALLNFGFTGAAAAGPALAGLLLAAFNVQTALIANAVSFVAVAALLASARGLPNLRPEAAGWVQRLRDGLRYVRGNRLVRTLLGAQAIAFVFFTMVIPVEVVLAKQTLGAGDSGYAALLVSWGGGMVAGGLLFAALRRRSLPMLLVTSSAAIGVAYLVTAAAPTLLVACIASAIGGAGNGTQWVALISALQELTPAGFHARVISLLESAASAMPGLGFILGGTAAAVLSPRATFAIAGFGVLAVLAIVIMSLRLGAVRAPRRPHAPHHPA